MRRMAFAGLAMLAGGCTDPPMKISNNWFPAAPPYMAVKHFWSPAANPYGLGGSYAWVEAEDEGGLNPAYQGLLRGHVDRVLGAKGYALADANKADFWLSTYIDRRTRSGDTGYHEAFDQATVVLEALQQGEGTVLWRGALQTRLAYDLPPAKRRKRLKIGVEKILKDFPGPRDSSGDG